MRIIEVLKKLKDNHAKLLDLRGKIGQNSAYVSFETPRYPDQTQQVSSWLQMHKDIVTEQENLTFRLHKTNLLTNVTISIGGNNITKTIDQWILRRRTLSALEMEAYKMLTDKNIMEGKTKGPTGEIDVKIIRCYDPKMKDEKMEVLRAEPSLINAQLEIINATTDLMEM